MTYIISRRGFVLATTAFFATGRALAALAPTPSTAEGPFYPLETPPDDDSDHILAEPAVREAGGDILHFSGRVISTGRRSGGVTA